MQLFHKLPMLALAAVASLSMAAGQSSLYGPDDIIPFAEEPTEVGPDADVAFVDEPGYSSANETRGLTFDAVDGANRELQIVEGVVVGFQIAAAAAPIIAEIIKGTRKECQQLACWIATDSRTCALSVIEKVQAEVTQGRDRYRIESMEAHGAWVRYWRTKFEPIDRGDIVTGSCTNGVPFAVTNCMSTGRVHC